MRSLPGCGMHFWLLGILACLKDDLLPPAECSGPLTDPVASWTKLESYYTSMIAPRFTALSNLPSIEYNAEEQLVKFGGHIA